MKKIIWILLAFLGCLAGCSHTSNQENTVFEEASTVKMEETNMDSIPQLPQMVKEGQKIDEQGALIYISNSTIENDASCQLFLLEDTLITAKASYDLEQQMTFFCLDALSTQTGEVLNSIRFPDVVQTNMQIANDNIVVCDSIDGKIYVITKQMEQTAEYTVGTCDYIFVNAALTEAYCVQSDTGIHVIDLESNQEKRVLLADMYDVHVAMCNGNYISLGYVDAATSYNCFAGLNLENGELEFLDLEDAFWRVEYTPSYWLAGILNTENMYLLGTLQEPYKSSPPVSEVTMNLLEEKNHLMGTEFSIEGAVTLYLYDSDGVFLSSITLSDGVTAPMYEPVWSESAGGYFFTAMNETYQDQLFFWDLSVEVTGENLELIPYDQEEEKILGGEAELQAYYDQAKNLSEIYGVEIKIADQCSTDYATKTAEPEMNTATIQQGLSMLEKVLGSFPQNFLKQLTYGSVRKTEINLMGKITEKEAIEGHNPVGFVESESGIHCMVLNITSDIQELESVIYHEFSHIIDQKLEFDALLREDALYSDETWCQLNPQGFAYSEQYGVYPEEYWNYLSCFMDDYSMTFSGEDRARIFEYAAMHKTMYFHPTGAPVCLEKLKYYCECIRDGFDTTGWPEETVWEYSLNHAGEAANYGKG